MQPTISPYVIRPEPTVFNDYEDEKFEKTVVTDGSANPSMRKVMSAQGNYVYITEKIEPSEFGQLMRYKGVPYLRQGFIFPEAAEAVNNLKRLLVMFLAIIKGKGIKGRIGAGLAHFCWIADWMFLWYNPNTDKVQRIFLKPNRYRQSIRELIKLVNSFISNAGITVFTPETHYKDFGLVIGTLLEYDNAYHWRMEDLFSVVDWKEMRENPRKELQKILVIYQQREKQGIEFKLETIIRVMRLLFLVPNIKKAFQKALDSIDTSKLPMVKDDSYFTMIYEGYDFQGKNMEERKKIWLEMTGGVIPERVFIPAVK